MKTIMTMVAYAASIYMFSTISWRLVAAIILWELASRFADLMAEEDDT